MEITETLQAVVWMQANSAEEALSLVQDKYRDAEYVLDADSFAGVEIKVLENEHKRAEPAR